MDGARRDFGQTTTVLRARKYPRKRVCDVKEFATQGISVLGEVAHPGIYQWLGSRRLFDAIAAAGGTTNRAGKTITVTHRDPPDTQSVLPLSQNAGPKEGTSQNPVLQAGDTLIVSRAGIV